MQYDVIILLVIIIMLQIAQLCRKIVVNVTVTQSPQQVLREGNTEMFELPSKKEQEEPKSKIWIDPVQLLKNVPQASGFGSKVFNNE